MELLPNKSNSSKSSDEASAISVIPVEILENILHRLPLSKLLKCREVSRKWKSAATLPTREKCAPIPFSSHIFLNERITALKDFNNCAGVADGEFPVSKFHFTWNARDRWLNMIDAYDAAAVEMFFELVSPFITELSMDFRMQVTPLSMNKLTIGVHDYPKLTCLKLEVIDDCDPYEPDSNRKQLSCGVDYSIFPFLRGVIEKASNMKNIFLKIGSDVRETDTIFRCIQELGIRDNLKILTSLTINTHFNKVDWTTLIRLRLKLKIFKVTLGQSDEDTDILKAFLETQANTLNTLILHYNNNGILAPRAFAPQIFVNLPCLQKLQRLKITETNNATISPTILRFPRLSYQKHLPALKELCLSESLDPIPDLFSTFFLAPVKSLQQINLPRNWRDNGLIFLQVFRIFPNITKLQVNHLEEINNHYHMRVIFENMTTLEELCIPTTINNCYDSIITGLSDDTLSKIGQPPSESFNKAIKKLDQPTAKTMACLESLKVLKLHKVFGPLERGVEISEISGHVLKKMKSLRCLDFGVRQFPPLIRIALKEDLEEHGIKFIIQCPPHRRSKVILSQKPEFETDSESDDELQEFEEENGLEFEDTVDYNEEFGNG